MPVRPSSQAQRDAVRKHDTEKVERITIRLPIGTREFIKPTGMSVNAFVVEAVTEKMNGSQIQIPDMDRYRQAAKDRDISLEDLIVQALEEYLKSY